MGTDSLTQIILLALLLVGSAFFSASETALMSISRIRVRHMVDEEVRGARLVSKLLEKPNEMLGAILVGNNIVNISASAITTSLAISYFGGAGVVYATAFTTVLVLIFGEITPKALAANDSEGMSLRVARPIRLVTWVLKPITVVMGWLTSGLIRLMTGRAASAKPLITEAELRTIVEISQEEGVIESEEKDLIDNVFGFGDRRAKDVITSRTDISALDSTVTYDEVVTFFKGENYSRAPVYEDTIDNIVGVVHVKDLIGIDRRDGFDVRDYMKPPLFSFEFTYVQDLMQQMRKNKVTMAIILDEYGGTSGVVTMEDLVEEIVGDIYDEHDDEDEEILIIKEDEFVISGTTNIATVNDLTGTHLESEDYDTLAGYVLGLLGRIPAVGETVEALDCRFLIEAVEKNRITRIRLFT